MNKRHSRIFTAGHQRKGGDMFVVVYRWRVKEGQENLFQQGWEARTGELTRDFGALGSRLHRADDGSWVAYAQWPNREAWEKAGKVLKASTSATRMMFDATEASELVYRMDVASDLLVPWQAVPDRNEQTAHK